MGRFAVGLEYDGARFAGWQSQARVPTIQSVVEAALTQIADEPVSLIGAGRTDAGVHALGQVAHFDTRAERSPRGWVLGTNTHLPPEVSVTWAQPVADHFHARYSAEGRTYRYYICNRRARSALAARRATHIHHALDHERMALAGQALIGEHDFSAFRSAECQARSPVRRLSALTVQREGDWVMVAVTANAFLHHMVRNIAGLLIAIGQGKAAPAWSREVLESRDRSRGAPTAAPDGLYLWRVHYPAAFDLPGEGPSRTSAMIPGLPGFGVVSLEVR
jgi:tRNA pseudouridine38-40 synthase